jgi:hypothetical protein
MEGRLFTHPSRQLAVTRLVYHGKQADFAHFSEMSKPDWHPDTGLKLYWGDIHGHTELSDGRGTLDDYFRFARDEARLDFCAVTDHDHGGVGRPCLWEDGKWELTQSKVAEYHQDGRFVTILAYERDSYPWFSNLCLYYRFGAGELVRGEEDGQITEEELRNLLARKDIISIPHHTADVSQGVNFPAVPLDLMPPLTEIYSKWGVNEYFGNPHPVVCEARGGHWRDALEMGARMGCVAGSDVHLPRPGVDCHMGANVRYDEPGILGVWAPELTREAIWQAVRLKHTIAASGARVMIDFRVCGQIAGSEIAQPASQPRRLALSVQAPSELKRVDVIKNGIDVFHINTEGDSSSMLLQVEDGIVERPVDYYYVRVTLMNGRQAWCSPIWVKV